jgi:hypothetical protein
MLEKNIIRKGDGDQISHRHGSSARAAYIIPIALALLMSRVALDVPGGPAQSNVLLLVYAGAACFSALLFVPVDPAFAASRFSKLWRRSALVVLVFVLAVLLDPQVRAEVAQIVPLASMLFLLMMVALMPILAVSGDAADARQVVFATLATLFATPIWLGPLAEQTGNPAGLTNLVVAVSPLSALAVSLDMDYLRTGWFYKNSVLGSLRYDYLPWFAYAIIFTIIILGFTAYLLRASLIRVSSQSDTRPLSHENNK